MPAVAVDNLVKAYATRRAVNGISFFIQPGETYALLGPNGAGKTTTIEILEGYRRRDGGHVEVLGCDPGTGGLALKQRIGIVLQSTALEPELTVGETVAAFARLYRKSRPVDEVIEDVDLTGQRGQRVGTLSGGQKRRLDIALGIVGDPDLVFLDEPTTGLDPDARRRIWELVRRLNRAGRTILLSSHHMDEVEALAARMAIMVGGRIAAEGAPADLQLRFGTHTTIRLRAAAGLAEALPADIAGSLVIENGWASLTVADPGPALAAMTGWAQQSGASLASLTVTRKSLEDIYLDLTRSDPHGEAAA